MVLVITSCVKKSTELKPNENLTYFKVKLDKDCSGNYITDRGATYRVCNLEVFDDLKKGAEIEVAYTKIDKCDGEAVKRMTCSMYHENEGWIEITGLKK